MRHIMITKRAHGARANTYIHYTQIHTHYHTPGQRCADHKNYHEITALLTYLLNRDTQRVRT